MAVFLELTEEMIKCFNECSKKGDYGLFIKQNQEILKPLSDHLKKVKFENHLHETLSAQFKFCFDYIAKWNPKKPETKVSGTGILIREVPEFMKDLENAIKTRNWNYFYWKYRKDADGMIAKARELNQIDFSIHYESGGYESFEDRDYVAGYDAIEVVNQAPSSPVKNFSRNQNDGGMIQKHDPEKVSPAITKTQNNVTNIVIGETLINPTRKVDTINQQTIKIQTNTATRIAHLNNGYSSQPGPEQVLRRSERIAQQKVRTFAEKTPQRIVTETRPDHVISEFPKQESRVRFSQDKASKRVLKPEEVLEKPFTLELREDRNSIPPDDTFQQTLESLNQATTQNDIRRTPSFDYNVSQYQTDLENSTKGFDRNLNLAKSPRITEFTNWREDSLCRDSPISDNSSFNQKLHEQNLRNAEELETARQRRKQRQAEREEELKKMREESRKRFEILLQCILMKYRFEQQEEYWKDWIQGCRQHIIHLLKECGYFVEDINKNYGGLRKPENIDMNLLNNDIGHLLGSFMTVFNGLQFDFENLKRAEKEFPDALFVRVLQKCIADAAQDVLSIYTSIGQSGIDVKSFVVLQNQFDSLKPDSIYSTSKLHTICNNPESSRLYHDVKFPDINQSFEIDELL